MKTTLKIDNRDLSYTIDTYGMFTGDWQYESEVEYYKDEYELTDDEAQQIDFDYDHPGIVKALAESSINILWNELKGDIVQDITLDDSGSPQFYNYTTDHYTAEWTVNTDALEAYIRNTEVEFKAYVAEKWDYEYSKAVLEQDTDTQTVVALDFWTGRILSEDQYNDQMFEREFEVYSNNMKPTDEMQKLIDQKQAEMDAEADRLKNQTELNFEETK